MPTFESLKIKIDDFKARINNDSITPVYLGTILEELLSLMRQFPEQITEISTVLEEIVAKIAQINITAGEANTYSRMALDKADGAFVTANEASAKADEANNSAVSSESIAKEALASAAIAVDRANALANSFVNTIILPFDGIIAPDDEIPEIGIWYVADDKDKGHFDVRTNNYGYSDSDYNSHTPGGAVYPIPARVWVCVAEGRIYISQNLRITPMLSVADFEFNSQTASLNIRIDSKWL